MTDILEQLRDQSLQLARRSFDSVDAGLAANVADAAIDEIERLRSVIRFASDALDEERRDIAFCILKGALEPESTAHHSPVEKTGESQS